MVKSALILAHRLVLEGGAQLCPTVILKVRQTLESLAEVGVTRVCVIDGEHAEELRTKLELHTLPTLDVAVRAYLGWKQSSGSVVLSAADFFAEESGPCLVLQGDRPLSVSALSALGEASLDSRKAVIAVGHPAKVGHAGEVRVRSVDASASDSSGAQTFGRVEAIGPDLQDYSSVFSGHVLVRPSFLEELAKFSNPGLDEALLAHVKQGSVSSLNLDWTWSAQSPADVRTNVAAILKTKQHPKYTLLNPGPVNTTARVKSAMIHHDVCHRDSNFQELMVSLSGKLRRIFRGGPEHSICVVTGSGTAAMEMALSSAVPRDGKILVIDNGAFGERLFEIARTHEMEIIHLRYAWGDEVKVVDVKRALEDHPGITSVAMTYHETSVGLLNPVREVGALCREYGALCMVDAVSALGSEDLDVVRDNVDICWASANKCLHAISGAGFLCVSPRAWASMESIKPRSFYLDLKRYRYYAEEHAQTPFTPAVSTYFALEAACSDFLDDGHEARLEMYRQRNKRLRNGLIALGMEPLTRNGNESHSLVTACVPDGVEFCDMYSALKQQGFIVYGCKDVLADRFFQVANMGDIELSQLDEFLRVLSEVISMLRKNAGLSPTIRHSNAGRLSA